MPHQLSYHFHFSGSTFKLMKIETRLLARDFLSIMFILMFIDSIHHLYTEEEEVQMMEKVFHFVDSSQIHQVLLEKRINTY